MARRGIAVALAALLLLAPVTLTSQVTPVAAQHAETTGQPGQYVTGRPVDSINLDVSGSSLSIEVTDNEPQGTTLTFDRDWLRDQIGKPVEFTRFQRNGQLIDSYTLTPNSVIIHIPHFSTQNITATAVDAQFEVSGSASGAGTTRIINYDVDETGIAILEIHGQGTKEGTQQVEQFFSQVDNSTFTWSTGEIPRNVTLELTGHGEKFGPVYNKTHSAVGDGSTVFFDLAAKDYNTNVTIAGSGQEIGTPVTKGTFLGDGDGDTRSISFAKEQSNESIVFIGNTTGAAQNYSRTEDFDLDNSTNSNNVTVENGRLKLVSGLGPITYISPGTYSDFSVPTNGISDGDVTFGTGVSIGGDMVVNNTGSLTLSSGSTNPIAGTIYAHNDVTVGDDTSHSGDIIADPTSSTVTITPNEGFGGNAANVDGNISAWKVVLEQSGAQVRSTVGEIVHNSTSSQMSLSPYGPWNTSSIYSRGGVFLGSPSFDTTYINGDIVTDGNVDIGSNTVVTGDVYHTGFLSNSGTVQGTTQQISQATFESMYPNPQEPLNFGDYGVSASQGFYERQYSTSVIASGATLNWTDDESAGTVQWFVKTDNNAYVEWTNAENDTLKDIADGQNVWVRANLTRSSGDGPTVDRYGILWQNSSTTQSTDPAIDVNGDGTPDASVTGTLSDGQSVTRSVSADLSAGSHTFWVNTSSGSVVDWRYEGNNDARAHVQNFSLNGVDHTVDQFLAAGQSTTISVPNTDTLIGQNSLTLQLYDDTEATQASRVDIRGEYEARSVVDNLTVNGNTRNLDAVLADGQTTSLDVTTDAVYGDNDIRIQLKENSTQDNYDAEFSWYPENRTAFSNVTVNGQTFDGADEYGAVPYNVTFLGSGDVLTLNVTGELTPGSNDHVFRTLAPRTTTDTLDFVEKMDFEKNVTVTIEERSATYNKSTTETFDHDVTSGATFNYSTPGRVMRVVGTQVTFDGTTSAQNSTTWVGNTLIVQVDESIPAGTTVDVRAELLKYNVTNADDVLRDESDLGDGYKVDVGISGVTGNVSFLTVEKNLTEDKWEVITTSSGSPIEEVTDDVTFSDGNLTIPQSEFANRDGFTVQRPRYSRNTYTGTVNTIYPTVQIAPDRDVTHDPALYSEPDETYEKITDYSVTGLDSTLEVEWKQVSAYHRQWITTTTDDSYNQTVANFSTENVAVFEDGEQYTVFALDDDGDLTIESSDGTTTWDIYQYEDPTIASSTTVQIGAGQTKNIQVVVENPNDFILQDTRLVLEHGWIESVSPIYQDIPANGNATYNVTIHVPAGTASTEYTLPMNVTSQETGEVDTKELKVNVGGGLLTAGAALPNIYLVAIGVAILALLGLIGANRAGKLGEFRSELEEL